MDQRVSVITLGVDDLEYSRRFYEALGWETRAAAGDDVVFYQAGGMVLGLWDWRRLAEDSGIEDGPGPGFGGVTLAQNVASPDEVDKAMAHAEGAGAIVTRPAAKTFWGGYSGVFLDPDGHPWEVAYNPHWTLHPDGTVSLARSEGSEGEGGAGEEAEGQGAGDEGVEGEGDE